MTASSFFSRASSSTLFALALATGLLACDASDADIDCGADCASAYAGRGEYAVGTSSENHGDLRVRSWYPSDATAAEELTYAVRLQLPGFPADPMPFLGRAIEDASVARDGDGFPLVVLSHGFLLNPEWYAPLAEQLASHGFVVVAPEHRETDWDADVVMASVTRPQELSAVIDLALVGPLAEVLDSEHIAVLGHSYGGYSALAAAGARIDYTSMREQCAAHEEHAFLCAPFVAGEDELASAMGLTEAPQGLWPSMVDPRIDAIVPIAGDAYLFGAQGLASVEVPMLAIGGTADTGTPWEWGSALAYEHAGSSDKRLVAFEGSEHFPPIADCSDMPWMDAMPEEFRGYLCEDPAWAKSEAQAHIHHFVTAFLLETLKGDARAARTLDSAHYTGIEGLRYQRTSPRVVEDR